MTVSSRLGPDGFDAQIEAVRRPPLAASTLPPEVYWSPEIYKRELDEIFFKEWICVGRVEDIPNPGDYVVRSIATEPIIVVRGHDGAIHAHLNVCRHRGCELVDAAGSAQVFKCPYHGWLYGLDGELRGAPEFAETDNFSKADYSLLPVRSEIWEGFVLINLDPDAAPFADRVQDTHKFGLEKYRMGSQVTVHRWRYDLACNWKAFVENYIEEYHVPWVHAGTFQPVLPMKDWVEFPDITDEPWALIVGQFPGYSFSETGEARFPISPDTADLPPKFAGVPVWMIYPCFGLINAVDCTVYYLIMPDGPERCEITIGLCLPPESAEAFERGDQDIVEMAAEYVRVIEEFAVEDNEIAEKQHRGLRSRNARQGRFCKHERLAWEFDKWVSDRAYANATPD